MKKVLITLVFTFCMTYVFGQTQAEMNREAYATYQKTDKELNQVYGKILKAYAADTTFIHNLKASQQLWIRFRDAELKTLYPDREPGFYGSLHPVCRASYLAQLTQERIYTLQKWLTGAAEGDACAGSVRVKQ
ncbi:lysozyme inhibitor LprI family protein [Pontibacter chitinilyticus]|uniref:lysozyme inhibitor LprI family protein n=1 Tax=Pontibacter chitinilyticus TaxID=2674989 RepID=UPI00321BAD17